MTILGILGIVLGGYTGRRKALSRSPQPQPTTSKKLKTPPVRVIWVMIIAFLEPLRRTSKTQAKDAKKMCLSQLLQELMGKHYELFQPSIMLMVQAPQLIHVLRELVYARRARKCTTEEIQVVYRKALFRFGNKPVQFQASLRKYLTSLEGKGRKRKKPSKRQRSTTTAPK